jgi:outer membrane protein OmpA-like peptidoglycan-associated protein
MSIYQKGLPSGQALLFGSLVISLTLLKLGRDYAFLMLQVIDNQWENHLIIKSLKNIPCLSSMKLLPAYCLAALAAPLASLAQAPTNLVANPSFEQWRPEAKPTQVQVGQLVADWAEVAQQLDQGADLTLGDVLFAHDQAALRPEAKAPLDTLAKVLAQNPAWQMEIEGHTDHTGDSLYNLRLSAKRAAAVADYLVSLGMARACLHPRGLGESVPLVPNPTPAQRYRNRRVRIRRRR